MDSGRARFPEQIRRFFDEGPHASLQNHSQHESRSITEDDIQKLADECAVEVPTFDLNCRNENYRKRSPIPVQPLPTRKRNLRPSLFESLPLEVQHHIFDYLDLDSVACVRGVNYAIYEAIESLVSLRRMRENASDVMRTLKIERLSKFHSIGTLSNCLMSNRCVCGRLGPYLFLLTAMRCCRYCASVREEFDVMEINEAIKSDLYRDSYRVRALPQLYSYKTEEPWKWLHGPQSFVSTWEAKEAVSRKGGIKDFHRKGDKPSSSATLIIPMPYFTSTTTSEVERGFYCKHCANIVYFVKHPYKFLNDTKLRVGFSGLDKRTISGLISRAIYEMEKNLTFTKAELKDHIRTYCADTFQWEQHKRESSLKIRIARLSDNLNHIHDPETRMYNMFEILATHCHLFNVAINELDGIYRAAISDSDNPFNFNLSVRLSTSHYGIFLG